MGVIGAALIIFLFLALIAKIAIWRISGIHLSERENESLKFSDGELEYGYESFAGSVQGDRVVKLIPLKEQKSILYNKNTEQIIFSGVHYSTYYSNYRKKEIEAGPDAMEGKIIIYDYFTPSLLEMIQSEGWEVVEKE